MSSIRGYVDSILFTRVTATGPMAYARAVSKAGVVAGTRDEADAHGGAVVDAVTTATSPRVRRPSGGSHDVENGAELTARRALTHSRSGSDSGSDLADGIEMNELRPRSRNTVRHQTPKSDSVPPVNAEVCVLCVCLCVCSQSTPNLALLTREWSKSVLSDGELNCYSSVYEDGDSIGASPFFFSFSISM